PAPKILVWRRTGKIGNANMKRTNFFRSSSFFKFYVENAVQIAGTWRRPEDLLGRRAIEQYSVRSFLQAARCMGEKCREKGVLYFMGEERWR
uniref:hypothetical protein n=1 Tax=uncultured Flavonifractor sp. TaxID=1193534 RepID=UPI002629E05F